MILFIQFFNDGGTYIMYPILIMLFVVVFLFIKAVLNKSYFVKTKALIVSISWFAIAWGYLGRTIGLIKGFDNIQAAGDISPAMLSGHLKMALLGPLGGIIVFLIARVCIIILISINKNKSE